MPRALARAGAALVDLVTAPVQLLLLLTGDSLMGKGATRDRAATRRLYRLTQEVRHGIDGG